MWGPSSAAPCPHRPARAGRQGPGQAVEHSRQHVLRRIRRGAPTRHVAVVVGQPLRIGAVDRRDTFETSLAPADEVDPCAGPVPNSVSISASSSTANAAVGGGRGPFRGVAPGDTGGLQPRAAQVLARPHEVPRKLILRCSRRIFTQPTAEPKLDSGVSNKGLDPLPAVAAVVDE